MRYRLSLPSSLFLAFLAGTAHPQDAIPFRTRNLNPLVAIFGLPAWHVPQEPLEFTTTTDIANHYRLSLRGADLLIADGETVRTSAFVSRRFGEKWSLTFELPYYSVQGGVLDDVVDAWHSAFRLPDGGRNNRPEGLVEFRMARDGEEFFALDGRGSGIGDALLGVVYSIGEFGVASVSVKAPTGSESVMAGSGATDWSVSFLRPRNVSLGSRSAGYYWGVGVISLGEGLAAAFDQRDSGYFGVLGGSLRLAPRVGLKAQIDMHSPLYRSELEEIGERAWQGTFGGWWQFGARGTLDFAVNEDLEVSTSPDVVIHVGARWLW